MALSIAMDQDKQFRESLPTDYMDYMGIIHSADVSEQCEVVWGRIHRCLG